MPKDIIILRVILSYLCFTEGNDIYKTQDLIKFRMLTCSMTPYGWMAGCSDIHLLYFNAPESYILNNRHVNLPRKNIPGINPELYVINQLSYYTESLEPN